MVLPNTKATLRLTFVLAVVPSLAFEGTRIVSHMPCTPASVNLNYCNSFRCNYYYHQRHQEEEESWIRKRKNVRWTSSHLYAERLTDEEQQQQQQVSNGIISATACAEKSHLSSEVLPTNVKTEGEDQDDDEEGNDSITKGLSLEYNIQSSFNLPYSKEIRAFLSQPLVELNFCILVLVSSFLVALGTLPAGTLSEVGFDVIDTAENVVVAIFTLEFFARWYSFGQFTGRYLKKPLAIIDVFVVVLPFTLRMFPAISIMLPPILSSNSGLITLTLLRVLRLQRILKDMDTFSQIQVAIGLEKRDVRPYQLEIAKVVVTIFTLLSVSSGLIYTCEHNVNPAIPDYFTALYFGLTTLTTVGFGDIAPVTFAGRIVVCGSILFGVTVIPYQAAALVEALLTLQTEKANNEPELILIDYDDSDQVYAVNQDKRISSSSTSLDQAQTTSIGSKCGVCGNSSNRQDASFCWSCGAPLKS